MCSLIPSFQPLVIHACGDLVLWMNNIENVLVFLSCPSVHTNGVWIRMAAIKLTLLRLALVTRDQSAHLPVFLHLRDTDIPGPNSAMRSEQAQQRRLERRRNKERRQR